MQSSVFGLTNRSRSLSVRACDQAGDGLAQRAHGSPRPRLRGAGAASLLWLAGAAASLGCASDASRPDGIVRPDAPASAGGSTTTTGSQPANKGGGAGGSRQGAGGSASTGQGAGEENVGGGRGGSSRNTDAGEGGGAGGGGGRTRASTSAGGSTAEGNDSSGGTKTARGGSTNRRDAGVGKGGAQPEEEIDAGPLLPGACRPNLTFDLPLKAGGQPRVEVLGRSAVCVAVSGALLDWGCTAETNARHVTCNGKAMRCADTGGVTHDKVFPAALSDGYRYFHVEPSVLVGDASVNAPFTGSIWWVPDTSTPPPTPTTSATSPISGPPPDASTTAEAGTTTRADAQP